MEAPVTARPEGAVQTSALEVINTGIPPIATIEAGKTNFLNEKPPGSCAVMMHLHQGVHGLNEGRPGEFNLFVQMLDNGEIHFPDGTKPDEMREAWRLTQNAGSLYIIKNNRVYGIFSREQLQNGAVALPTGVKGEQIGISYFNPNSPATDPDGTSVGIFKLNREWAPVPVTVSRTENRKSVVERFRKHAENVRRWLPFFLVLRFAETNLPPVYDAVPPSSAPPPEAPWIPQDPGFVVEPSPAPTFEPSPTATPELSTATPTNSPTRAVPSATPTEAQPTSTSTPTRSPVTPGSQKG